MEADISRSVKQSGDPQGGVPSRLLGAAYALTVFVSAFLLFQVQPLISKYILPRFGFTPGVWTTCMLFFQVTLFAGYAYAHLAAARFPGWMQTLLHLMFLGAGLALLPIVPDELWKPAGEEQPTWRIVSLLTVSVGLPFFVLSMTGPLLQHWFSRTHPGRSPYRLYALSNVGSLLALVSYPFLFEPALSTTRQAVIWSWGFGGFALLCAFCALGMATRAGGRVGCGRFPAADYSGGESSAFQKDLQPPTIGQGLLWFVLAMIPSVLLLAMTNQVCLDVASVPFLWVVPLSLYLLSFILCFDSDRWYSMRMYVPASYVFVGCAVAVMIVGVAVPIWVQALVYFGALFTCAMVCHGELVGMKPHPQHLTAFYLVISAGGAAGGLFVGVLAPAMFPLFLELHIGLAAFGVLSFFLVYRQIWRVFVENRRPQPNWKMLIAIGMLASAPVIALVGALTYQFHRDASRPIWTARNFYGVLRVNEKNRHLPEKHVRELLHGRILHGVQYQESARRKWPTSYYGSDSGVGRILLGRSRSGPMKVGLVGLGAGTLASYALPGDVYRFYDINPLVVQVAREYFTYLGDCQGEIQLAIGDARLSMEREEPQDFDVLALDAFSSDAIPTHLLTVEAFEIYLKHIKQNGVLAVHISNRHFDLCPVVDALADHFQLITALLDSPGDDDKGTFQSSWVLLSRELEPLTVNRILEDSTAEQEKRILWTDDNSNLFRVLRHRDPEAGEESKTKKEPGGESSPEDSKTKNTDTPESGSQQPSSNNPIPAAVVPEK